MIHGRFKSRSLPSDSFSRFFFFTALRRGEKRKVEEKQDRSRKVTKREKIKIRDVKNRSQRRDGGEGKEEEERGKQRDKTEEQRRDGEEGMRGRGGE